MVLRWAAVGAIETEKRFRKIIGHRDLWLLKAVLDEQPIAATLLQLLTRAALRSRIPGRVAQNLTVNLRHNPRVEFPGCARTGPG